MYTTIKSGLKTGLKILNVYQHEYKTRFKCYLLNSNCKFNVEYDYCHNCENINKNTKIKTVYSPNK